MEISKSIFREYDIRGIYPKEINEDVIEQIAKAISVKCLKNNILKFVLVEMEDFLVKSFFCIRKSLSGFGINVINIGLVSTPLLYFAAKKSKCKSGIMITGSHNPKNYNGIKLVINDNPVSGSEIYKLIDKIHKLVPKKKGTIVYKDIKKEYIKEVKKNIDIKISQKLLLIVEMVQAGCIAPRLYLKVGM